jgi:tetratricopeptide (TPR) repeat protein
VAGLRLAAVDFAGLDRWRWVLNDAAGTLIADHEVRLDATCWQYEAFTDLLGYLSWNVTPDQRAQDEARIVGELGAWIGAQVLGPVATALAGATPTTVRVVLPPDAAWLAFRPLELAHAGGKPLAAQDVTLVIDTSVGTGRKAPMGDRLRVLGLFSLPEGARPLSLRRERQALVRLMERIAASGKAADVRVLQYGVTRDRLREILEEAEGWDIIHISGHGAPGELLLETAAGMPDRVTATEMAGLLRLARKRVALVTLSACWSASLTAAQQRRLLRLPVPAEDIQAPHAGRSRSSGAADADSGTLATALAGHLNCAVLAMRYPVDDEFAIALSEKLYELLADKAQPLPRAVGLALRHLARDYPALLVATPALFGARAIDLRLAAPERTSTRAYATGSGDPGMTGFPPQPTRFVGRSGVMARASAALAARSGIPGVLLHGMPGGGKSACALELAYGHRHAFDRLVWYKAPDEGMDITGALTDFALTLERYVPGSQMIDVLADDEKLAGFLPRLTALLKDNRLLLVIDNAESLLSGGGRWRDARWGQVIGALTAHRGLGRVIMTSRHVSRGSGGLSPRGSTAAEASGFRVEAVDALSADEALLLARELSHLQALIQGKIPGLEPHVARRLARRALTVAQGHPLLLEFADGQAAQPERLTALVEAGDQAWRKLGGLPDGFFTTGEVTVSGSDFLHVLGIWTQAVTETLTTAERDLFWFLCCLEEPDRQRAVLNANWAGLWHRLGRDGEPPGLDQALTAIAATGLVAIRPGANAALASYSLHPAVSEAGRARAGIPFRNATDTEAAAFWDAVYDHASGTAGGTVQTRLAVRAGLAGASYLLRQQQWQHAAALLERAFQLDPSRANAAAVLPAITQVTRHDPSTADVLALVLRVVNPAAAETVMRDCLDAATAAGDYKAASGTAGRLADLCRDTGRLTEALALAEQKAAYTRQAGLGPWNQLADEVWRLQVLARMGQASHVLAEVTRLRSHLATLPATRGPDDTIHPWNVREALLDTGRASAILLGRWAAALDLNAAQAASQRDRNAPTTDAARVRFKDYSPLLRLGRTEEALTLLRECHRIFQDARDTRMLGQTLSALADAEDQRGHGDAALRLERDALRYLYLAGDVAGIAVSYHNHGNYLRRYARQPAPALASHLATDLIRALAGIGGTGTDNSVGSVRPAATDLRDLGTAAVPPASVADLDRMLGDISGTDLPGLVRELSTDTDTDTDTAERILRDLIARARVLAAGPPEAPAPTSA